jgi:pimeloyl-ACP methyl ester carboxylesterase
VPLKKNMMNSEELQLLPFSGFDGVSVPIAYRFLKPDGNKPVFVWFSGFKSEMTSTKAEAAAAWARQNSAGCLRFDYSGHGWSGGRFKDGTISAWLDEAAAVLAHVEPRSPLVFAGSSMGGWIALLLARRLATIVSTPLKGIVLIAPAWNMTRLIWEAAPEGVRALILDEGIYMRPSAYGEPYAITKGLIEDGERHIIGDGSLPARTPIRVMHGCRDPDVPWRHSIDLLGLAGCEDMRLTLVKDGEHRLSRPQDLAVLYSLLQEFL